MSQCVPSWDLDGHATAAGRRPLRSPATSTVTATTADIPLLDYEVTELTWENGHLALHGLGPPRVPIRQPPPEISTSSPAKYPWDNHKPLDSETLESIVNPTAAADKFVPWFDRRDAVAAVDALVPCPNVGRPEVERRSIHIRNASYTPVGSCSGPVHLDEEFAAAKRARIAAAAGKQSSMNQISVSGSARDDDSRRVTFGTYDTETGLGFTETTSLGSPENTKNTAGDDRDDSVCHYNPKRELVDEEDKNKRARKSSGSTKRSRAAAIHNQSERKRRDKINQRMETLQKLVPNSSKTDKASMLDEVIEYLKQLQGQANMMSRMNMPSMMLPMAMQQMSMMAMQQQMQMSGMGMMDINTINTINTMNNMNNMNRPTTNMMMSNPFMHMAAASWDGNVSNDNPMAAFLACQSQQMGMDGYSQMAALYQHLQQQQHQQPAYSRKS